MIMSIALNIRTTLIYNHGGDTVFSRATVETRIEFVRFAVTETYELLHEEIKIGNIVSGITNRSQDHELWKSLYVFCFSFICLNFHCNCQSTTIFI